MRLTDGQSWQHRRSANSKRPVSHTSFGPRHNIC